MRIGWAAGTALSLLASLGGVCRLSWAQPEVASTFSFTGRTPPGAPVPLENLFVVGDLLVAQPQFSEVARWGLGPLVVWDGSRWSGISDTPASSVSSLVSDGERLYLLVRGSTEEAPRIDTWDGAGWTRGALPVPEDARQLAYCDEALLAIGWVVESHLVADSWIARWNGATWTELFRDDDPEVFSAVAAAGPGPEILVRTRQRATGAESFERWRAGVWHSVPVPESVSLDSFAWSSAGWLGIERDRSSGADQAKLYRLQEDSWKPLGPSFPARSFNLLSTGEAALLGTLIGEGRELTSALWSVEGDSLRSLGALTDAEGDFGGVEAAVSWQGGVVCGGSFVSIGGVGAWNVAVLRGSAVERIRDGDAIDGEIEQIAPFGDGIAVAGDFAYAGALPCFGLAIRSADGWIEAPAPRPERPWAMQEYRGTLSIAAGDTVSFWTGAQWEALGGVGHDRAVTALGLHEGDLIAAGMFLRSGSSITRGVARWDGAHWSRLGGGIRGLPNCLESWSGNLVIGGDLREAEFNPVSNIALWDGADWYPMGLGLQRAVPPSNFHQWGTGVVALARYGDLLLAAGDFVRAGSEDLPGIALWDGAAWRRLGDDDPEGIRPREVSSIAVSGNRVFAYGTFEIGRRAGRSALCVFENGRWRVVSTDMVVRAMQALADGTVWISASRPEALLPGAMRVDLLRLAPEDAPRLIDRPSILSIDALGPIPARGSLDVRYSLTRNAPLRYGLYNVGGRRIVEIDGGVQAAGPHAIHIDAESLSLPLILSGVYFLRIEAGDDVVSRRIVVVR